MNAPDSLVSASLSEFKTQARSIDPDPDRGHAVC